jgi:hypothetical protein
VRDSSAREVEKNFRQVLSECGYASGGNGRSICGITMETTPEQLQASDTTRTEIGSATHEAAQQLGAKSFCTVRALRADALVRT